MWVVEYTSDKASEHDMWVVEYTSDKAREYAIVSTVDGAKSFLDSVYSDAVLRRERIEYNNTGSLQSISREYYICDDDGANVPVFGDICKAKMVL